MKRSLLDYIIISLKGMAMGAADAIPGVSGGTIAFISGVYQELIDTIGNINITLIKSLFKDGITTFWKNANGNFITALILGIAISFVSFLKLANYLLEHYPVLIWSFFFGLILASIYFVGKQVKVWNFKVVLCLFIGTIIAYKITTLPTLADNTNSWFLFIAGAIAICAMILPGISGAFILILLGAYKTLSNAIQDVDIKQLIIFSTGAFVGLLSFSKLLKWLFKTYKDITLAILTGFILGSLNKVWPWKKTLTYRINSEGIKEPFHEASISPFAYGENNQLLLAIALILVGVITIFVLEYFGRLKQQH